jgi:hypothetical protein
MTSSCLRLASTLTGLSAESGMSETLEYVSGLQTTEAPGSYQDKEPSLSVTDAQPYHRADKVGDPGQPISQGLQYPILVASICTCKNT